MKYRTHMGGMPPGGSFAIIVDSETMTWTTEPPDQNISKPFIGLRFVAEGGAIGSGKFFDITPDGRARRTK